MLWLNGFVVVPESEDLLVCYYDVVGSSCEFSNEFALFGRVIYGLSVPSTFGSSGIIVPSYFGEVFGVEVGDCSFKLRLRDCDTINVFDDFEIFRGLLRSALRLKVAGHDDFKWISYSPCFSLFDTIGDLGLRRCFRSSFELVGSDVVLFADVFTRLFSLRSLFEIFGFDLVKFKSLLVGSTVSYISEGSFTIVDVLEDTVSDSVLINGVKTTVSEYIKKKYGAKIAGKINPREPMIVGVAISNGKKYYFAPSLLRLVPRFDNLSKFSRFLNIDDVSSVFKKLRLKGERWKLLEKFVEFVDPLEIGDIRFNVSRDPFVFSF